MAKSLQDQLLKAGLVNKQQVKKVKSDKRRQGNLQRKNKIDPSSENAARLQQTQAEQAEKDRLLNLQRKQEAEQKAVAAQVRQLVEQNRQKQDEDGMPFNFQHEGKVKRIYVDEPTRERIVKGALAIVFLDKKYELVPSDIAGKIGERDPSRVVLQNVAAGNQESENDPYADFKVPDDLMW